MFFAHPDLALIDRLIALLVIGAGAVALWLGAAAIHTHTLTVRLPRLFRLDLHDFNAHLVGIVYTSAGITMMIFAALRLFDLAPLYVLVTRSIFSDAAFVPVTRIALQIGVGAMLVGTLVGAAGEWLRQALALDTVE